MSQGEDDNAPRPQSVAQLLSKRGRPPSHSPRTTASNRERFSNLFSSLTITSAPVVQDGSPSLLRRMLAYATPQTLPARATTLTAENLIGEPEAEQSAQATPSHLSRLPDELLVAIFLQLGPEPQTLAAVSLVSTRFYRLTQTPMLWIRICQAAGIRLDSQAESSIVASFDPPAGRWDHDGWVWEDQPQNTPSRRLAKSLDTNRNTTGKAASSSSTPIHFPTLYRAHLSFKSQLRHPSTYHPPHLATLFGHGLCVYCVHHGKEWIVSGSRDRSIRLWRKSRPAVRSYGPNVPPDPILAHTVEDAHHGSVLCLAFDEHDPLRDNKGLLVTGSSDSTAVVWEVDWGVPVHVTKLATLSGHSAAVLSVVLTPTHIVTASRDHNLRIFSRVTFELQHTIVLHTAAVNCLTTCVDSPEQVVSASSDGTWAIIDGPSASLVFGNGGPGSGLACVARAGEFIVTGDNNRSVKLWTSSVGHLKTFVGHTDLVRSVAIDLDTRVVVSASYDRTVRIWDLDTGEAIRRMSVESMVFDLQVSPGSLVCGSEDGKVRIWTYGVGLPYRDLL